MQRIEELRGIGLEKRGNRQAKKVNQTDENKACGERRGGQKGNKTIVCLVVAAEDWVKFRRCHARCKGSKRGKQYRRIHRKLNHAEFRSVNEWINKNHADRADADADVIDKTVFDTLAFDNAHFRVEFDAARCDFPFLLRGRKKESRTSGQRSACYFSTQIVYKYDFISCELADFRIRRMARSLIWRTRSRVNSNFSPISSSVKAGVLMPK